MIQKLSNKEINELLSKLERIPGGYIYSGAASYQVCFPLKAGGELRLSISDEDPPDTLGIDLYDGALPPGISGYAKKTGNE